MTQLPEHMHVLVCRDYGRFEIETRQLPSFAADEALVRVRACGVSAGELMAWYMRRKVPIVPGREPAGEIVAVGSAVENFRPGDRVFVHHRAPCGSCRQCLHKRPVHCETWRGSRIDPGGMAEYVRVPRDNLLRDTLKLPEHLSYEDGALIEPVSCVLKALQRVQLKAGDRVVVMGLGAMGALTVRVARLLGASTIIGIDRVPFRLEKALKLGADHVLNLNEDDPGSVQALTDGDGADVVVVGPPQIQALDTGIEVAGLGARVVLFSPTPPAAQMRINPHELHTREISLIPSYSSGPDDTRQALEMISKGDVLADQVVTHRFPLEEAREAYSLTQDAGDSLKVMVVT
jgi:L-iditol 2-dehydrogenase